MWILEKRLPNLVYQTRQMGVQMWTLNWRRYPSLSVCLAPWSAPGAVIHAQLRTASTRWVKRSSEGWKDHGGLNWALRCCTHLYGDMVERPSSWGPPSSSVAPRRGPFYYVVVVVAGRELVPLNCYTVVRHQDQAPMKSSHRRHWHVIQNWRRLKPIPLNWRLPLLHLPVTHLAPRSLLHLIHHSSSSPDFPENGHPCRHEGFHRVQPHLR
jgi:hypothetical protein